MIITREGKILEAYVMTNGIIVKDGQFSICLDYDEQSREYACQIKDLKANLRKTDYKALKHADGVLSDEEYASVKEERQQWRDRINALQELIIIPTITRDEMDVAEQVALEYAEQMRRAWYSE